MMTKTNLADDDVDSIEKFRVSCNGYQNENHPNDDYGETDSSRQARSPRIQEDAKTCRPLAAGPLRGLQRQGSAAKLRFRLLRLLSPGPRLAKTIGKFLARWVLHEKGARTASPRLSVTTTPTYFDE